MSMVGFPLLLIPLAIYNIIVFLMPGVSLSEPVVKLTLMSGAEWPLTLSDMLLALGIILLLFEVIKGARPGGKYLTDHLLSLIIFGGAAAEFLLWPRFAQLDLFSARAADAGGFRFGHYVARASRGTNAGSRASDDPASPLNRDRTQARTSIRQSRACGPCAGRRACSRGASGGRGGVTIAGSAVPELQPGNGVPRPPDGPPH